MMKKDTLPRLKTVGELKREAARELFLYRLVSCLYYAGVLVSYFFLILFITIAVGAFL